MIAALTLALTVSCQTLIPLQLVVEYARSSEGPYLKNSVINLKTGSIYKRWDLTKDGKVDVMTSHVINPEKLPAYRQLVEKGIKVDTVEAEVRPFFYWVDFTGVHSWDRIYVDKGRNGTCELYARQDEDA